MYALDLASGSSYLVAADVTPGNINAAAYNPTDGYLWGYLSTPSSSIVRIGQNFVPTVYTIPNLPTGNRYVGDIDSNGMYYCKAGGTTYYKIDLNPNSANYLSYLGSFTLSQNIGIADWAFNAVDGQLYTVEGSSGKLYRIDPSNGVVTNLGSVPSLQGLSYTFGAIYFDASGHLYASANQTGTVYIVKNVQTVSPSSGMISNTFCYGPAASSNDGARCPTAPVPQEDCVNGIDDDGDGLIDCADPSCSGVASCPVTATPVGGGNQGGLESNGRLSQQINQRNYIRNKTSYTFDSKAAPTFTKAVSKTAGGEINLQDLIPSTAINGTTAIVSSASDLIKITNATDILSVDYMQDGEPVAVILATKTENGVYEHTKYICDRLLGAELLSVSTITIKEQTFIKSIIKNNDGSVEFVLSFSGRLINNDDNFEIESHWNIDKYQANESYFNFQIWTNKIDDLITLGEATIDLLDQQKTITNYNNSTPPPVFVKKGKYKNGALELEVINTNLCKKITFDAGLKRTETSPTEFMNASIELSKDYMNFMRIETGKLFDIGFRIENDMNATADDLFMSDGPWGIDDATPGTNIHSFIVNENEENDNEEGFSIERNIELNASTSSYLSVYRAFTPRFKSVDLSDYNTLEFDAAGTGQLEITIIKKGIDSWDKQFKTSITLQANDQHYYVPYQHFTSTTGEMIDLSDAVSIVFTMASDGVNTVTKELNLANLNFSHQTDIIPTGMLSNNKVMVAPNPMTSETAVYFNSDVEATTTISIYSTTGRLVKTQTIEAVAGSNKISLSREGMNNGLYILKLNNSTTNYETVQIVLQ